LVWEKGASDGDASPVDYYVVYKKLKTADEWEVLVPKVIGADNTKAEFTLTDFNTYEIAVTAVTSAGASARSASIEFNFEDISKTFCETGALIKVVSQRYTQDNDH
jgi:hypothetical protein